MRSDARRNREQIVAAASHLVAAHGADVSLEEVARRAGVGSATLHRHFPTRQTLLEAVFRTHVEALCERATSPDTTLRTWLHEVGTHASDHRGLAAALLRHETTEGFGGSCHELILKAGAPLVDQARTAGTVAEDVSLTDLLHLVSAIALATEHDPERTKLLTEMALIGLI